VNEGVRGLVGEALGDRPVARLKLGVAGFFRERPYSVAVSLLSCHRRLNVLFRHSCVTLMSKTSPCSISRSPN